MRIAGKVTMVSVALVAAATLSACANSEQASTGSPTRTSTPPPPSTTSARSTATTSATTATAGATNPAGAECTADDIQVTGDFGQKPTITIPATCQPPKQLLIKDLKPGTGAEIKTGSSIQANYLLQTWSDKKLVDNSFDRGQPLEVQVGSGQVIQGWEQGLLGLKQNGRRLLVIPPDLGYGAQGKPPVKPNETLVFVTDAVQVS
ncbi:FKBP-type peptidyl-prolyl cis-trans isomerase [Kibdelosporangium persicum]|uniref:Peptidyl-prolyl cis-trans isomerase n=1 Tax=Kibdelosporangium persicum TaxID=2698649 RepID=A0ABX2EYX7_9PSEU|nr:FKBP-type peptidyl-prolyl cis-trans isomerase [Kibdelosporangium persicum]NRN64256.1 FKBP-type peptidyl-prolyl cis-trans isomerase [Kibdelosporangium persicum]